MVTSEDIRVFLDAMDDMKPGVTVRKGTDGFWYAAYVPQITPPVEIRWKTYRNALDAIRLDPDEKKKRS